MFRFDVKYTFDNYMEFYKNVLVKKDIIRNIIFAIFFVGLGIMFLVQGSKNTTVAIIAIVMGCAFPLISLLSIPMLKKQIRAREAEFSKTHIDIAFYDDEIIYTNLTVTEEPASNVESEVKEEVTNENNEEIVPEEVVTNENNEETVTSEVKEEIVTNEDKATEVSVENEEVTTEEPVEDAPVEEVVEEKENQEPEVVEEKSESTKENDENVIPLKYANFMLVKESRNLLMFYLDRSTTIIIPKDTLAEGGSIKDFKEFILTKVDNKFVKFNKKFD